MNFFGYIIYRWLAKSFKEIKNFFRFELMKITRILKLTAVDCCRLFHLQSSPLIESEFFRQCVRLSETFLNDLSLPALRQTGAVNWFNILIHKSLHFTIIDRFSSRSRNCLLISSTFIGRFCSPRSCTYSALMASEKEEEEDKRSSPYAHYKYN